ncbi:hypothetical protein Taro_037108 [Colocasia esculenta]|uniref:Transmembrane protein n=1 Tax=Colocasia esculenta TaxID=4460 RepID=A0A843W4U4_COLES|nr:hypothetical protein [Colocasia esculenta]
MNLQLCVCRCGVGWSPQLFDLFSWSGSWTFPCYGVPCYDTGLLVVSVLVPCGNRYLYPVWVMVCGGLAIVANSAILCVASDILWFGYKGPAFGLGVTVVERTSGVNALDINSGLASRGNPSLLLSPPSSLLFPHMYPCASSLSPAVDGSMWEGSDARNSGETGIPEIDEELARSDSKREE